MGSIVRLSRKHQVVVPKEAREALGVGAGDELLVEVEERGKVTIKARPKNYAKHMLGLHKNVWKGVKVEEYIRKEREAWTKETSSNA